MNTLTYVKNTEEKESSKINPKTKLPYKYFFCSIRTKELTEGDKEVWINGFGDETTREWERKLLAKEEVKADLYIYDEEYQGKKYKKFKRMDTLSETDKLQIELEETKRKLEQVSDAKEVFETKVEVPEIKYESDVKVEDLPF